MHLNKPILSLIFFLATPIVAHHSDAIYDFERLVAFEAVVTQYTFRNPHVMIFVEANNNEADIEEWEIETGSVPIMIRSGWSSSLLKPGDVITIRAHPEKNGRNRAILNTLETSDGNLWSQVEGDLEATESATSIEGVWKALSHTNIRRQFVDARLTTAALEARDRFNDLLGNPISPDQPNAASDLSCIPHPTPFTIGSVNYLSGIEVFQDYAILRNEFFDLKRVVYMDGRGHPEDTERTIQGHSIGWWEGETLVVDTQLFDKFNSGNGIGIPSGYNKHVVERYSLNNDGTRAIVDVIVEDPDFLIEPFTGRLEMLYTPHLQLYEYGCIPGE
ncbi:MAG: hypothetical protein CBC38_01100 [Gammaproteobacteria bacterium TMED78]|nr:MAG: hypothetical protein CBC38_01100 [Gammaproteobacteria bacterium TMED78]|tara:strand:+ start:7324 stop:8319 length:996 start_codon:yes stop_codon:yes gene_type:complete